MDKRTKITFFVFAFIVVIIILGWNFVQFMNDWAAYDPKEAAKDLVSEAIDKTYENQNLDSCQDLPPSCGGSWVPDDCWTIFQEMSSINNNRYSMSISFYNWEDESRPTRGGDEIDVLVLFEDGSSVKVQTYESVISYCWEFEE